MQVWLHSSTPKSLVISKLLWMISTSVLFYFASGVLILMSARKIVFLSFLHIFLNQELEFEEF